MKPENLNPTFRYMNEFVGVFILAGFVLGGIIFFQAGRFQDWFDPGLEIKIIMPDDGLFGLSAGARIEILGTEAGVVEQIVIDPNQRIHAIARVRSDMAPFVRVDSRALIRKQFGVAGASFLEITRGTGALMDPELAVLRVEADSDPTQTFEKVATEVRDRVLPVIEDLDQIIGSLAVIVGRIEREDGALFSTLDDIQSITRLLAAGEGTMGRLLAEDELYGEMEDLIINLNQNLSRLEPIMNNLDRTSGEVATLSEAFADDAVLFPQIVRDLRQVTRALPDVILQSQETLRELDGLLEQLQQSWLLGGGGDGPEADSGGVSSRLSPEEVGP